MSVHVPSSVPALIRVISLSKSVLDDVIEWADRVLAKCQLHEKRPIARRSGWLSG
jgi:hypothetical protein